MPWSPADLDDLTTTTLAKLPAPKFSDVSQELQHMEMFSRLIRKGRVDVEAGTEIQGTVRTQQPNTARMRQMFETDNISIPVLAKRKTVPWRQTDQHYAWERREILMNRSPARLTNLLDMRRSSAILDLAELMEVQFIGKPSSSTDDRTVWGLEYWIVVNANTGFNGGLPSGFTTVAGIDIAVHTRYKNYTAQYTNVTKDDLIKKMSTAHRKIKFIPPQSKADFRGANGDTFLIYMDEATINEYEMRAEEQNDNLGKDGRPYDDATAFRRHPVRYLPVLDDNSTPTNPVYMLNANEIKVKVLSGDFLAETGPVPHPHDHNTRVVYIDLTWNIDVGARNRHAVLAKA